MSEKISLVEYCKQAGSVLHTASIADTMLFSAFVKVAGCHTEMARAIYYTIESMSGRKNLIRRVTDIRKDKDIVQPIALKIADSAIKAANLRNEVAHAHVSIGERHYPDPTLPVEMVRNNPRSLDQSGVKPVTKAYLAGIVDGAAQACLDARENHDRLCELLGVPPQLAG